MNRVAEFIGYAVMLAASLALVGVGWWFLLNGIYRFFDLNRSVFAATWLLLREPELVKKTRAEKFDRHDVVDP